MENIKKLPQLGRACQSKDYFTGDPIISNYTSTSVQVDIYNDTPVIPFSNGSEFSDWDIRNCGDCTKSDQCQLIKRLSYAYFDNGKIQFKTAKRIGYKSISIQKNGVFVSLTNCKEKSK